MAHVFIFNGAPNTGKDYLVDNVIKLNNSYLKNGYTNKGMYKLQFKDKLFELVKTIYSLTDQVWDSIYERESKELPNDLLDGLSPRQAIIKISEEVIKPNYGKDYFGRCVLKDIEKNDDDEGIYLLSDGGFMEEVYPIIENAHHTLTIFKLEDGIHTFEMYNDSRGYLDVSQYPQVKYFKLFNQKTWDDVENTFVEISTHVNGYDYE